jgi:hypothetical protein
MTIAELEAVIQLDPRLRGKCIAEGVRELTGINMADAAFLEAVQAQFKIAGLRPSEHDSETIGGAQAANLISWGILIGAAAALRHFPNIQ